MTDAPLDDGLKERFGAGPAQGDLEARQWRQNVAARLFGRASSRLTIGRFQVLQRVGSGGAGVVYSAWDPKLERRVAVKVLRGEHDPHEVEHEAKLLAKLNHPNVVAVYDVGECDGASFVAMEFVDGQTLQTHLEASQLRWAQRLALLEQAASGLVAAHEAGIVHGDVKPGNLLVGADGRLRVTDFGTAHLGEDRLLGATPAYMAPEQAGGNPATTASDQFSLCATAFEVFYGVRPYPGDTADEIRAALAEQRRTEVPTSASIPRWLRDSIERGLAHDPNERYPDLASLLTVWKRGTQGKRGWVATAALGAGVTVAAVVAMNPDSVDDPCASSRDRIAALWAPPRRAALAERFAAHGQPFAEQAWSRVQADIDTHVDALQSVLSGACAQPNEETSLRRRLCVERRVLELSALLDVLETDDPSVIEESVQALALLTDPQGCVLDARPLDALDEALRREVLEAVARARALRGVGKVDDALRTLQAARVRAHELRDPAVTARILLELGDSLAMQQGVSDQTPTLATLEAALLAADAADAPNLTARALLSLAGANYRATRFDDALLWLDRLDRHLEGSDADRLGGRAAMLRALVGVMQDPKGSDANTREALDHLRDAGGHDTWLAQGLNSLGELEFERFEDADAAQHYTQALDVWREVLGPSHPNTAGAHGNLGEVALLQGDHARALEHFDRALEIRSAAWGSDSYWVEHTRAHVADALRGAGRIDEAREAYLEVLAFTRRQVPMSDSESFFDLDSGTDQLQPWALHGLALIALQRGDAQAALTWAEQVDPRATIRAERHPDLAARFDLAALALLDLGRLEEARAKLDRIDDAWTLVDPAPIHKRIYAPLARAELEAHEGHLDAACTAASMAASITDPGVPEDARARLEQALHLCPDAQPH